MIKIYHKNGKEKIFSQLSDFKPNTFIYVEDPSEEDINLIAEKFSLDVGLLLDSLDQLEVPRVEMEDGVVYIFTRFAYSSNSEVTTAPMLVAFRKGYVITVSKIPFPRLQNILSGKTDVSTAQQRRLMFRILSQINATYYDHLNTISKRIRGFSVRVEKIQNRDIIQFVRFENILDDFNSALVRMSAIYGQLLGGKIIRFDEDEMDSVEDLALETGQLVQLTKESIRSITNIREAYSTIMTNNLNQVIKLFTSLTVILTVPNIIASMYGMNVPLPLADNPYAFWGIEALILGSVLLAIIIFARKNWL